MQHALRSQSKDLRSQAMKNGFVFANVYNDYNDLALLYAQFDDFDKAFSVLEDNFQTLRNFVDETKILDRPEEVQAMGLPADITFARQEMREKVQFLKEKHDEFPELCMDVQKYLSELEKRELS